METITLDELTKEDAMMTRVDRKYLLRTRDMEQLRAELPGGTRVLEVGGTVQHGYETTYYDTPGLDCYLNAARKRRRRFKVRTRTYCTTGASFLELKTKGPRGVTVKERIPIDASGNHWAWFDTHAGRTGCRAEGLRPVLEKHVHPRDTLATRHGARHHRHEPGVAQPAR